MAPLGKNLRLLRKSRKWTQQTLAAKLKVSRVSIARIELGMTKADFAFVCKAADLFGVPTDDLRKANFHA